MTDNTCTTLNAAVYQKYLGRLFFWCNLLLLGAYKSEGMLVFYSHFWHIGGKFKEDQMIHYDLDEPVEFDDCC